MASILTGKYQEETITGDDLVTFLSSPMFQVPVLTFTESNCIVFESGMDECNAYRDIYADYKKMVELLLEDLLIDSSLSLRQIVKCLESIKNTAENVDIITALQEQVTAADNFPVFIRLMVQKNIELQQQALLLVMTRTGRSDILQPERKGDDDDEVLRRVMEMSRLEYEADKKQDAAEIEQLRMIMAASAEEAALLEERVNREKMSRLEYEADKKQDAAEIEQLRMIMAASAEEAALLEERVNQEKLLMTQAMRSLHLSSEQEYLVGTPIPLNADGTTIPHGATVPYDAIRGGEVMHTTHTLPHDTTHAAGHTTHPLPHPIASHNTQSLHDAPSIPQNTAPTVSTKQPSHGTKQTSHQISESPSAETFPNKTTNKKSPMTKQPSSGSLTTSKKTSPSRHEPRTFQPPVASGVSSSEAAANWLKTAQSEAQERTSSARSRMTAEMNGLSESQLRQRQAYLRKQRDILLEMKKQEREKQLDKAQSERPSSGRAGKDVVGELGDADYDKKMAMRKAIAEKVRSELMGKK